MQRSYTTEHRNKSSVIHTLSVFRDAVRTPDYVTVFLQHHVRHTHNKLLLSVSCVSDNDALDLLIQPLHAVPETRDRGLGDGDRDQDALWNRGLEQERVKSVIICYNVMF